MHASVRLGIFGLAIIAVTACKTRSDGASVKDQLDVETMASRDNVNSPFDVKCFDKKNPDGSTVPGGRMVVSAEQFKRNEVCPGQVTVYRRTRLLGDRQVFIFNQEDQPKNSLFPNFTYEGPAFHLYAQRLAEMVPIYACTRVGNFLQFFSNDETCGGPTVGGSPQLLGHVYPKEKPYTSPVYECHHHKGGKDIASIQAVIYTKDPQNNCTYGLGPDLPPNGPIGNGFVKGDIVGWTVDGSLGVP